MVHKIVFETLKNENIVDCCFAPTLHEINKNLMEISASCILHLHDLASWCFHVVCYFSAYAFVDYEDRRDAEVRMV